VIAWTTLPVWATSRQCCWTYHYRFACQAGSDVLSNIADLKLKPAVLAWASLPPRATSRQFWLEHHCRLEQQASSVGLSITVSSYHKPTVFGWASLSARTTSRQCWLNWHCRVMPGTDSLACTSLAVLSTGIDVNPTSLPVCHCRFKIWQWRGTLNWQWCPDLG
jgi:hypothetical protein